MTTAPRRPREPVERRRKLTAGSARLSLDKTRAEVLKKRLDAPASVSPEAVEVLNPQVLPATVLQSIVRRWRREVRAIVLFGSAARGEAWSSSDIDLLLVLRPGLKLVRALYTRWDEFAPGLSAKWRDRIDPHFVRLPDSPDEAGGVWLDVALEGVILWDPDLAASRFMADLRRFIAKGAAHS
jgi:predicted nucleotidyltransferase